MPHTVQSSGDLGADRRYEWARESMAQGDFAGAADLLEQTLDFVPGFAAGWFLLGEAREHLGDRDGAIGAFRAAREADPEDRHGAAVRLMRLGGARQGAMPPGYVRALYDHYASRFERSLVGNLGYRAPGILREAVQRHHPQTFRAMLDLGCGTGLAGAAFRDMTDELAGVDLSAAMLAQAHAKGIYDRLAEGDVVSFLRAEAAAGTRYDLILAADVFIYLDDLRPVTRAASALLAPGGLLAFTLETHEGEGAVLRDTLRFAFSADLVREALASAGLRLLTLDPAETRTEKSVPVPGLVCVAQDAR